MTLDMSGHPFAQTPRRGLAYFGRELPDMRHVSRLRSPVRIAALSLWLASLTLMVLGTMLEEKVLLRSWALWIQMVAWGFTAWWIADGLSRRDRLRVAELAEIMARVAVESSHHEPHPPNYPRRVNLTRVH